MFLFWNGSTGCFFAFCSDSGCCLLSNILVGVDDLELFRSHRSRWEEPDLNMVLGELVFFIGKAGAFPREGLSHCTAGLLVPAMSPVWET